MLTVLQILEIALPVLYAAVFVIYLRHFVDRAGDEGPLTVGSRVLYGTLGIHVGYLALRTVHTEHIPVASSAGFLSLVALCIGLVYAFAERKHSDSNTGVFFLAMVVATQTWSSILTKPTTPPEILEEYAIYGVHVAFTVFGFTALAVSALYALMYVLLSRQLKSRNLGVIFRRLPPLTTLENMGRLATLCGIVLLGVGLGTGHFLAVYILDDFEFLDPKIVITYVAWTAYAAGYFVVKLKALSGIRMAYLSLIGYLALIGAMVVVNTFLPTFHSFQ